MVELDEVRKAILAALATMEEPAGCGQIARKANLSTPNVVGRMWGFLKDGFVESIEQPPPFTCPADPEAFTSSIYRIQSLSSAGCFTDNTALGGG